MHILEQTMVIFRRAAVASLFILLGACSVGEVPTGGGGIDAPAGGGTAEASFNAQVMPLLTRCVGCHSGAQQPVLTSYATLAAKYKMKPSTTNTLVNKGDHAGITYFTPADKTTVATWVDSLP